MKWCLGNEKSQQSILHLFQCVFFCFQFSPPEGAAGQECGELYLAGGPGDSPLSVGVPSWFLLRCSRKCTFPLPPPQNQKQTYLLMPWENAHMQPHIDSVCEGSQLSFFLALFCLLDPDIRNIHTHCQRNLLHLWAQMKKGWTFSMFFQPFFLPLFIDLPPLTGCISIAQAFSISSLQVPKYWEKPIIAAQFCQENASIPNVLLMQKQEVVSSANLSALTRFVSGR